MIVIDENGCLSDTSNLIYFDITGIGDVDTKNPEIIIFPNPVNHIVIIKYPEDNPGSMMSICDTKGRILMNRILSHGSNETDISFLAKGIYLIKVPNGAGCTLLKLVKE